jgi:hypothetical protein
MPQLRWSRELPAVGIVHLPEVERHTRANKETKETSRMFKEKHTHMPARREREREREGAREWKEGKEREKERKRERKREGERERQWQREREREGKTRSIAYVDMMLQANNLW